ncbi:MAG: TolC family protein [Verrucomicrobia bacterium]|nr:TolC family protein [Verrucomicrobiota bacterium]
METRRWFLLPVALAACCLWAGCGRDHYHKSADKEVYGIIGKRQGEILGKTNGTFSINTPYSSRKPAEVPGPEIIEQRLASAKRPMTLVDAIKTAVAKSREYQFQKERVYLTALTLTSERYDFKPKWAGSSTAAFTRNSRGELDQSIETDFSVTQLLKTGGRLSVSMANSVLAFYTGGGIHASTPFLADFTQPLLRGAGYKIATEDLTQAERNVVYDIRSFARFEQTFAVDIVTSYFRLLQQREVIRNDYGTYQNLSRARDQAEALSVDRMAAYQVDQVRQDVLTAMSRYIQDTQDYRNSLDLFKIKLGLPVGEELVLDDRPLEELRKASLPMVSLTDDRAHQIAVQHRLDVQNDIDKFEDSKRKIEVAANGLMPDLNIFASVKLNQPQGYDYSRFDVNQYQTVGGVELNLPLDRLRERNTFRGTLITFEQQLRSLSLSLDNIRNDVRVGLRTLEQKRKDFDIQAAAVKLANRRVESATLLLQAGRAQMRDLLDAQSSLLTALNAFTRVLVDYHAARWSLLTNLGVIRTDIDDFWMAEQPIPQAEGAGAPAAEAKVAAPAAKEDLIPPDRLFR